MRRIPGFSLIVLACTTATVGFSPVAQANDVAYLVGVTVRPGYNFADADAALAYGHGICDRVGQGIGYSQNIAVIKTDFSTNDDYQAAYLINQAVNELCPALIWQLRETAAHYTGGPNVPS